MQCVKDAEAQKNPGVEAEDIIINYEYDIDGRGEPDRLKSGRILFEGRGGSRKFPIVVMMEDRDDRRPSSRSLS